MSRFALCVLLLFPALAHAAGTADIVILGEVHDNPTHHRYQAEHVAKLQPSALVFEMLTEAQAVSITPEVRQDQAALREALNWDAQGWPDFAMYYSIIAAAPDARIYGAAIPRENARQAFERGIVASFKGDSSQFGLDVALDDAQQKARIQFQDDAHCGALPTPMLPKMVALQRLRDAELARVSLMAFDETAGPVAVITGNGHARKDWGIPVYLSHARPKVDVISIGQSEAGQISGVFDKVQDAPAINREDPCAAFAKD